MLDCWSVVITAVPKDPVFEVYLVSTCFQKILLSYISLCCFFLVVSLPPSQKSPWKRTCFPPTPGWSWFVADRLGWLHSVPAEFGKLNMCFLCVFGVSEVLWFADGWLMYFLRYPWYSWDIWMFLIAISTSYVKWMCLNILALESLVS